MKENYEKNSLLIGVIIVFILIELISITIILNKTFRTYSLITVIVVTDNYVKTYVDDSNLNKLKSSNLLYLNDRKINYKIISVEKSVLKSNKINYHEVMINFKIPKKYKDNDSIPISIYSRKQKNYTIFKKCWESD